MSATHSTPTAALLAQALLAYQHNVDTAVHWAHPSWLAAALDIDTARAEALRHLLPEATATGAVRDISRHLVRAVGIASPDLERLLEGRAGMLDMLPPQLGLNVLRMRALRFRRAEVRRVVDKRTRQRLTQWTGTTPETLAERWPGEAAAPDIDQLAGCMPIRPIAALDAEALALEGHALWRREVAAPVAAPVVAPSGRMEPHRSEPFCAAAATACDGFCPMLRLALPRHDAAGPDGREPGAAAMRAGGGEYWISGLATLEKASGVRIDAHGGAGLIAQLPRWLPEWAWLFG